MNIDHSSSDSLQFNNTAIAFSSQSDADLKRSYWLFKLMGSNQLVRIAPFFVNLAFRLKLPIQGLIKATIFRQFCGGDSITDSKPTITRLGQFGIGTILDYSVEGKEREADFDATTSELLQTIETAVSSVHIAFCVFKVTGIARFALLEKVSAGQALTHDETLEYNRVRNRVERLCSAAFERHIRIFIDAEESWIQPAIDDLAFDMMQKYNKNVACVYTTLQLYRHDRLAYLKTLHAQAQAQGFKLGVKLVRGAYMEKERERAQQLGYASPIQPNKESSDRDYNAALTYCVEHIQDIAICAGTHNEESVTLLAHLLSQHNVQANDPRVYFSQLLGMSDNLSYNLGHHHYNVAKYVPYGPVENVLPYLIRRAQENTSIAGQTGRELMMIESELKRRHG